MARIPTEDMDTHTGNNSTIWFRKVVFFLEDSLRKSCSKSQIKMSDSRFLMEILEIYTKLDLHYGTLCQVRDPLNQEYMI